MQRELFQFSVKQNLRHPKSVVNAIIESRQTFDGK